MKKLFERMGGVESVYAAFRFLTLIPLGPKKLSPEALSWSSAHFPLVGISIGLLMSLCFWCFGPCGLWGAIALSLGVGVCITGALHEDGLADTADAMGGGDQKEKILLILKDSRVGTFGASALILSFMIRWSLLAHLSGAAP
ncbi:MAG: adenosylcobinamide-GDP ribazoletransferase, partial [Myxococcales bacterium]|nr:adenosylcobinamide-GDP ribazoletransferase [Myxococcales bacterium]